MASWVVLLCLSILLLLFRKLGFLTLGGRRRLQGETSALEWLRRTLPRLRAVIQDAEQREIKDEALVLWLQDIKDVACDAEDVIGEFEYEELRRKVKEGGRGQTSGPSGSSLPPSSEAMVHRIKEIRRRLDDIAKERNGLPPGDLGGWAHQMGTQRRTKQTSSLVQVAEVVGRDKEKDEIIEFLLASHGEIGPSVIAITGIGGLGKTTLAQLVYNDTKVEEHFDLKIWVYTTADYDVEKLTKQMLGSADYDVRFCWDLENLDRYQRDLMKKLRGRRFLLVIDNFSDRNHNKWQSLSAPLIHGEKGSKVLITSRDTKVSSMLQARKTVKLEGLPFDECWMLFKKHAFVDEDSGEYHRLEAIGKKIVHKFKGVPLAAITVGDFLYSKLEESCWRRILESEIWEVEPGEDGILSVLKLSYEQLSAWMKKCFAYCSLFPKNYKFDKLELVQQWMAQGFVQTVGRGIMEDVGTEYFDDLFSRSFFQCVDGDFVMHDLVHDLALLISQCDHLITNIDGLHKILKDSHKLRHLSLLVTSTQPDQIDLEILCRYKSLRTLVFYFPHNIRFQIPHDLFLSLTTLRVLDLSCGGITMLPESIGNLIHLLYLDLRRNTFSTLPNSLCRLYKLQTLKLKGCYNIEHLPRGIINLINLRHLEAEPYPLSGVIGIGKLTSLQELESFPISKGHGVKIEDLKDINELRGSLNILNLHWIRRKEEAAHAMLRIKQHIHKLKMKWGFPFVADQEDCIHSRYIQHCQMFEERWTSNFDAEDRNSDLEETILEELVPPPDLKELVIEGYDGVKYPSWLVQQCSKLVSVCLRSCRKWNSLPLLWCLPFLKTIDIADCPQLRELPPLPTTLRELTIYNVGLEALPGFYQPHEPVAGATSNDISPSLSILRISSCPALKSLQPGLLSYHLRNLTVLHIHYCEQLVYLPYGLRFQATLLSLQEELCIIGCPKLMALPASTLSASLKKLTIKDCAGVVNGQLFAQLHNLSLESKVLVAKNYENLGCCFGEALQHMKAVDWLQIEEVGDVGYSVFDQSQETQLVSLICDKERVWSWRCDDWVLVWRVRLWVKSKRSTCGLAHLQGGLPLYIVPPEEWWQRRSPSVRELRSVICGDANEDHHLNGSISACLGNHHLPWASSLHWLVANGIFHGAFLSSNPVSLEGLWIANFREMRQIPTNNLLSQLTGLKELQIFNCPELTLSSLQVAIQSLPSLQHLTIEECPKLSSSSFSCPSSPAATFELNAALLQTLFIDDANILLANAQFVLDHLSSLQGLHVWYASVPSFTVAATQGLRSIGWSLRHLSIRSCPNLTHLPSDLQSLLPFLKAMAIGNCPKLQFLPEGGLPTLLEILVINWCPVLEGQCKPPSPPGLGGQHQQQNDWLKISHIPVIVIDGVIVQGSYMEFLELRSRWRGF